MDKGWLIERKMIIIDAKLHLSTIAQAAVQAYSYNLCCFFFFFGMQGKIPFLSMEALHQLHIFIFVLAVVHVIFCVTMIILGGLKVMLAFLCYNIRG